ncbi:patatin-like phospholipase family protein [Carboxylicivirga sp. N1Y90]|uniref:patatin-like phospholipase family protein n=1 Tax=Carboxylicivirga fragile TaxID=3417571 RepID=UPI003D34A41F|nr:patatin-like phospholipase family protein [Marinilabiliaceae bacterium N1Y90]
MEPQKLKIGLAFSGGGFRAASFSLGVLSYLNHIKIKDQPLLDSVIALSTISGGTIAGARYSVGIKRGESFETIYEDLYGFMSRLDLIEHSLDNLIKSNDWDKKRSNGLIEAFADLYNSELFAEEKFSRILESTPDIHLKHISFNATEFDNALQFRFQVSETMKQTSEEKPDKGIIGNYYYRIPEQVAKDIRMADILAASSCFPGGFEPIVFPDDFDLEASDASRIFFEEKKDPIGLMDGGIVDNQGIEPLLLAEDRMKKNEGKKPDDANVMDLLIMSDVTSPYMEDYSPWKTKKSWWRRMTPRAILIVNSLALLGSIAGLFFSLKNELTGWSAAASAVVIFNLIVFLLSHFLLKLPKKFDVPQAFLKPIRKLLKLRLVVFENMIMNRASSLLQMNMDVFLKHIRRLNYNRIYQDKTWKNRRIMNAIYELRHGEEKLLSKIKNNTIPKELIPSEAMQNVADTASSMGTTLWFTKDELEKQDMLNSIIACGQFSMCWNLLCYIDEITKSNENLSTNHVLLVDVKEQLMAQWLQFKENPFWMLEASS